MRIPSFKVFCWALACFLVATFSSNSSPKDGEGSEWTRDLAAFETYLNQLVDTANIPTPEEFSARLKEKGREESGIRFLTRGGRYFVDTEPPPGTLQSTADELLSGKTVRWELTLPKDFEPDAVSSIQPAGTNGDSFLNQIVFKTHLSEFPSGKLRKGHKILIEGEIGDFSQSDRDNLRFDGATVIYFQETAHPIFWVGLDDVTITRVSPTEGEISDNTLSDLPIVNRDTWQVLDEAGDEGIVLDGDATTGWQTDRREVIAFDLGREVQISGFRLDPLTDRSNPPVKAELEIRIGTSPDSLSIQGSKRTLQDTGEEQEFSFPPVAGRFVELTVEPEKESTIGLAEIFLTEEGIKFPERVREPPLPPMAESMEKFLLLRRDWKNPPVWLQLSESQAAQWKSVNSRAGSGWYRKHQRALHGFQTEEQFQETVAVSRRRLRSPIGEVNFNAALYEASSDERRQDLEKMVRGIEATTGEYVSSIKRILTRAQQEKLRNHYFARTEGPKISTEWIELFDGNTLQGWRGSPAVWQVVDGILTGEEGGASGESAFLIYTGAKSPGTTAKFSDFTLEVEYRISDGEGGILFRAIPARPAPKRTPFQGYRAMIDSNRIHSGALSEARQGRKLASRGGSSTVNRGTRGAGEFASADILAEHIEEVPGWNTLEISTFGELMSLSINGQQMSWVVDKRGDQMPSEGLLALELVTGEDVRLEVRSIRIRGIDVRLW